MRAGELMAEKEEGLKNQGTLLVLSESAVQGGSWPANIRGISGRRDRLLGGSRISARAGGDREASLGLSIHTFFFKTPNSGKMGLASWKSNKQPIIGCVPTGLWDSGVLPWGSLKRMLL